MKKRGRVFLVGAGPGDPELMTLKAHRLLGQAHAVVYDRLVSPEILSLAPASARMIPVGKAPYFHPVPQQRINRILIDLALEGLTVVRLKGGDPYIFGRGSEEAGELHAAGIPVETVPGITAAQGAAAASGVPLTHRGMATSVRYVTGHCQAGRPLDLDWAGMVDPETTLVIYMGVANIAEITTRLIEHGLSPTMPVMAVANATTPREQRLVSCIEHIADEIDRSHLAGPVLFIVGEVVSLYRGCPERVLERLIISPDRIRAYA